MHTIAITVKAMKTRTAIMTGTSLLLALCLLLSNCDKVDPVAPPGSSIELWANPTEIAILGGISNLTIIAVDEDGYAVHDGTVIYMVTDLGRLEYSRITTDNGTAYNRLFSEGTGGVATIQAYSGSAGGGTGAEGSAGGSSETVQIGITVSAVSVTANPNFLPGEGGESEIKVVVYDDDYVPVPSVFVAMSTTAGTLASGGSPLITDQYGEARDLLTTTETADVTATVSGGGASEAEPVSGTATVSVEDRYADTLILTANPNTIVTCQNNGDVATITAHCLDTQGFPAEGAFVVFSLNGIGRLSDTSGTANSNGEVVIYYDLSTDQCDYCTGGNCAKASITATSGSESATVDISLSL